MLISLWGNLRVDRSAPKESGLFKLPPDLLKKIALLAQDSLPDFLLTCKTIHRSLCEVFTKATYDVSPRSNRKFHFDYPNKSFYPHLTIITILGADTRNERDKLANSPTYFDIQSITIRVPNLVNEQFLHEIFQFDRLRKIHLSDCSQITSRGWQEFFEKSMQLEKISLRDAKIESIHRLKRDSLAKLNTLKIERSEVSEPASIEILRAALQLKKLTIFSSVPQNHNALAHLQSTQLASLSLEETFERKTQFNFNALVQLLNKNPNLKTIELDSMIFDPQTIGMNAQRIGEAALENLNRISLYCVDINVVYHLIARAKNIRTLHLCRCSGSKTYNPILLDGLFQLRELRIISRDPYIEGQIIRAFAEQYQNLTKFTLVYYFKPRFFPLKTWQNTHFKNIKELIMGCSDCFFDSPQFNRSDLGDLIRSTPSLEHLFLDLNHELSVSVQ